MKDKTCAAAVVTADEWQLRRKRDGNCDKVLLDAALFTKRNAFAMRDDLAAPFSWAMTRLQNKGVYSQLRKATVHRYVDPLPSSCSAAASEDEGSDLESAYYITGPIILSFAVITLSLVVFVVRYSLRARRKRFDSEHGIVHVPSLREQLCGHSAEELSQRQSTFRALDDTAEGDKKLKMIKKLFEARHFTRECIHHAISGEAPITMTDIPMLVNILQKALSNRSSAIDSNVLGAASRSRSLVEDMLEDEKASTAVQSASLEQVSTTVQSGFVESAPTPYFPTIAKPDLWSQCKAGFEEYPIAPEAPGG